MNPACPAGRLFRLNRIVSREVQTYYQKIEQVKKNVV